MCVAGKLGVTSSPHSFVRLFLPDLCFSFPRFRELSCSSSCKFPPSPHLPVQPEVAQQYQHTTDSFDMSGAIWSFHFQGMGVARIKIQKRVNSRFEPFWRLCGTRPLCLDPLGSWDPQCGIANLPSINSRFDELMSDPKMKRSQLWSCALFYRSSLIRLGSAFTSARPSARLPVAS